MSTAPSSSESDWLAPAVFPPRKAAGSAAVSQTTIDAYLAALEAVLAGQIDPALEASGIVTPLGAVARAALVEAIGADLEAAVRDLMLAGLPREQAEAQAIAKFGPAEQIGHDLMASRRRAAVEAWQQRRASLWWWVQPIVPVVVGIFAVLLGAVAPAVAVLAGIAAERELGVFAVAVVPLVLGLFAWTAGAIAPHFDEPRPH